MKKTILLLSLIGLLISCTDNERARNYGGTEKINLPANKELVNVTWKGDKDIWILTRNRKPGETIDTFYFKEKSNYGILEGQVIIFEK